MGVLDVLQWVSETLDKPGAAVRGLLAGRPDQLANLIPFSDTLGITDPKTRTYGRDLLEQYGLLGGNTPGLDAGDVAGFGVDMLTDPLNWLGGGLLGKTALGAGRANSANRGIQAANKATLLGAADDFARQGQMVSRSNAASQAMRQAGALPEELLPEAHKVYRGLPTVSEAGIHPGTYTPIPDGMGGVYPLSLSPELDDYSRLVQVQQNQRLLDNEDINQIGRRLNEYFANPNPDMPSLLPVEREAQKALGMLRSNTPMELGSGQNVPSGINPHILDGLENQVRSAHARNVRNEMASTWNPGWQLGQEMSDDMKFALEEYMQNEGARLAKRNATADLSPIRDARTLVDELLGSLGPANSGSESFYVVPKGPVVDMSQTVNPEIVRKSGVFKPLANEDIAALQYAADQGKRYYDIMFDRLPSGQYMGAPEVKPGLTTGALIDPSIGLARFGEGANTYLPYVAPKLQARPRWIPPALESLQQTPKTPSWLLPMLGIQNTMATAGRY